jgi:hypothetical protein
MAEELDEATKLVSELETLAKELRWSRPQDMPRDADDLAIHQLAVFGKLIVLLARYMDRAQTTIKRLTWVLTAMTAVLVGEVILRFFHLP